MAATGSPSLAPALPSQDSSAAPWCVGTVQSHLASPILGTWAATAPALPWVYTDVTKLQASRTRPGRDTVTRTDAARAHVTRAVTSCTDTNDITHSHDGLPPNRAATYIYICCAGCSSVDPQASMLVGVSVTSYANLYYPIWGGRAGLFSTQSCDDAWHLNKRTLQPDRA